MKRGEIYWAEFGPPAGTRPVVIVTRTTALPSRTRVSVAHVTTRIRDIPVEVRVGAREGMTKPSVANCDEVWTIEKRRLLRRAGSLGRRKMAELDDALRFALGIAR